MDMGGALGAPATALVCANLRPMSGNGTRRFSSYGVAPQLAGKPPVL